MNELITKAEACLHAQDIATTLRKLSEAFGEHLAFSTSLSLEDQIITHFIFSHDLPIRVFTLDTGRLFPQTYETLERTRKKYGKTIEVYFPPQEEVERMVNAKGMFSFYESVENRKECCFIRKVLPLNRALHGVQCWITGIRAEHSPLRSNTQLIEWDDSRRIVKYQPLLHWSTSQVEAFVKEHNIPYNPLYDQGFLSIGCQPCTRAVAPGEDIRAGRWWWEQSHKECGLHTR